MEYHGPQLLESQNDAELSAVLACSDVLQFVVLVVASALYWNFQIAHFYRVRVNLFALVTSFVQYGGSALEFGYIGFVKQGFAAKSYELDLGKHFSRGCLFEILGFFSGYLVRGVVKSS